MTNKHRDVTCLHCSDGVMSYIGHHKTEVYKCKQCGSVEEVDATGHVREQFLDRSRLPHLSITDVWNESVEIYDHGFDAEVAKYHHPTRIVLLMKRTNIVTAIHIPSARYEGQRASILAMVRVGADSAKIANLLNECGITKRGFEQILEYRDRTEQGDGPGVRRNQHSRSEA